MSSDLKLTIKEVVGSRREVDRQLQSPGDAVLVERGMPRWLVLRCPCGCGDNIPINLDRRAGPAWRLYKHTKSGFSLYPSVWRDTDCGSHFIIWRDKIFLFGRGHGDDDLESSAQKRPDLIDAVCARLPENSLVSFVEIAEALVEIPWDILDICRLLVRTGRAREGRGKQRGMFSRP
jgi:hypothetical protein